MTARLENARRLALAGCCFLLVALGAGTVGAETPPAPPVAAVAPVDGDGIPIMSRWSDSKTARHDACVAKANTAPDVTKEDALIWRKEGGGAAAWHCVAMAEIAMGDLTSAARKLEQVAGALDGGDEAMRAAFLAQAGLVWLTLGDFDKAEASLDKAIVRAPNDPSYFIDRGDIRLQREKWREAFDDFNRADGLAPGLPRVRHGRAKAALMLGDLSVAEADITALLALNPADIDALVLRGTLREKRAGRPAIVN